MNFSILIYKNIFGLNYMNNNEMIFNDVETTNMDITPANVEPNNIAPAVINPQQIDISKLNIPRKTNTIIRTYNKKVGRNDLCPCGSGKKYKKCCEKDNDKYNKTRQLSNSEMAKVRNYESQPSEFKK